MRKIIVFNLVTVDGFFAGTSGEIDWHNVDDEFQEFVIEQIKYNPFGLLIFGRITYELMSGFWPTPEAIENDPVTANYINTTPKIVFSKTLKEAREGPYWKQVKILNEIKAAEILGLKNKEGRDIGVFGSGTIVQQFAAHGLIDEYQLLVNPIILGTGKPLFKDFKKTSLKLLKTRTFNNGNVLLTYKPAGG